MDYSEWHAHLARGPRARDARATLLGSASHGGAPASMPRRVIHFQRVAASTRQMRSLALTILLFFGLLLARANSPAPQQKPSPLPSPTPPSQLLEVQPAPTKANSPAGQSSPTPKS